MKRVDYPEMAKEEGTSFLWYVGIRKGGIIYKEPVFRREEEHAHGKMNDTSPNYWLLTDEQKVMRDEIKRDPENTEDAYRDTIEELDKKEQEGKRYRWIPYGDKFAQKVKCWSYVFEAYNELDHYSKYGSDDYSVKSGMKCKMFCNGEHVWTIKHYGNDMGVLIATAVKTANDLSSHPIIDFNNVDEMIGTKIWYHDQPCTIVRHFFPDDRIVIRSDRPDGKGIDLETHRKNRDKGTKDNDWISSEWHNSQEVHTGISDEGIYWFRS